MLKFNSTGVCYSAKAGFLLLVLATSLLLAGCGREEEPSVYDRVQAAGEIRASYTVYPPYSIQDPNTGEISGIFVEMLNEVGTRLKPPLKINWVEPVGWGEIFQGLNSDRHDIFGAGLWKNDERSKVGDFSAPLFCNPIKAYGRPDERRFNTRADINRPGVRISVQDGAAESHIAKSDFPLAQPVSITQLNPWTDVLLNITSGKADLTFAEPSAVNLFLDKNPGTLKVLKLKDLPNKEYIRLFANSYAFKINEPEFKKMLNMALEELRNDDTLEKIVSKYEKHPGEFVRASIKVCQVILLQK